MCVLQRRCVRSADAIASVSLKQEDTDINDPRKQQDDGMHLQEDIQKG